MESVFGLQGRDFVVLCADLTSARSIIAYTHDEDKIVQLDDYQLLAVSGDNSNRVSFSEYVEKNFSLLKLRSGRPLSNTAAANFLRNQLAEAIRSKGGAYQVNCLFGTIDETGPGLYYLDYLGTMHKVPYGAHGYVSTFVTSQFDAANMDTLSVNDAVNLVKQCCDQLARRFLINQPIYNIKVIQANKEVESLKYSPTFKQNA